MVTTWHISPAYRKPHTGRQHHVALYGTVAYSAPARTTTRRIPRILVPLLLTVAATIGVLGYHSLVSSSSTAASPIDVLRGDHHGARGEADGVGFLVDSGWRSPAYQEQLLRAAVSKYGSEQQAARWVATPNTSAHVSGDAVDVGPFDATAWLSKHGAGYELCQIYGNEPWHYELRPEAIDHGCPTMYADPTHDPRMQQ
jgi:D-alanyl-D-alanine carboxypeptidase